jgi:L-lactate permease
LDGTLVIGTLPGWLGVALTGTDANSNALFGKLQKVPWKASV